MFLRELKMKVDFPSQRRQTFETFTYSLVKRKILIEGEHFVVNYLGHRIYYDNVIPIIKKELKNYRFKDITKKVN